MQLMEYIVSLAMLAYSKLGYERSSVIYDEYDFIVVGGGSAGAIVASKLSENPNTYVLLLDSGGSSSEYSDIPYTYLYNYPNQTGAALKCFGADQPKSGACWGSAGNFCQVCESRILGGGSSINGFTYVRGTRADFDSWAQDGAWGWSYNEVLPYMQALETFDRSSWDRGTSGPIHVTEGNGDYFNIQETWLKAGEELGYYINPDVNGRYPIGFGRAQNNLYNGARQTTDNVFLKNQQNQRPYNLHVKMFSHATRVLFEGDRAVGVEYVRTGDYSTRFTVRARKEVILSAGAIQTPFILINSGVGPSDQVNFVGARHVADISGVGQNLQDHPFLHMIQFTADNLKPRFHPTPDYSDYETWRNSRSGPLATGSSSGLAILTTSFSNTNDDPQIELAISGNMHAKVILNAAKSRGQVRVRSKNIYDGSDPYVELNLLDKEEDIQNMFQGARALVNVLQTNAFKSLGAHPEYVHPACSQHTLYSDNYLWCLVKDATVTGFHYAGTAKIGPWWDSTAVVDERLKVHKVKGLRVADASVMPTIVRANPNAAVMLIGWKAAEMIKADYGI